MLRLCLVLLFAASIQAITLPGWTIEVEVSANDIPVGVYTDYGQTTWFDCFCSVVDDGLFGYPTNECNEDNCRECCGGEDETSDAWSVVNLSTDNDFIAVEALWAGQPESVEGPTTDPELAIVVKLIDSDGTRRAALTSNVLDWYCSNEYTAEWNTKGFDPIAAGWVEPTFGRSDTWNGETREFFWTAPHTLDVSYERIYCVLPNFLDNSNIVTKLFDTLNTLPTPGLCFSDDDCDEPSGFRCVESTCATPCSAQETAAGSCGYKSIEVSSLTPGNVTYLRTEFEIPVYQGEPGSTSFEGTFLCLRSVLDVPKCRASAPVPAPITPLKRQADPTQDGAFVRIPNLVDFEVPCQDSPFFLSGSDFSSYIPWGWNAVTLPSVSGLHSYLELEFDDVEVISSPITKRQGPGAYYFGFGLSHAFITRVLYDNQEEYELDRARFGGLLANPGNYPGNPPHPCDVEADGVDVVIDFFDECASRWDKYPLDSLWNAQTPNNYCYCSGPAGAPYYTPITEDDWNPSAYRYEIGFPALNEAAQYFWWYGTCNECVGPETSDPRESAATFIPNDGVDNDRDGVPNSCDRCIGYNDALDADEDRVPDDCDKCEGHPDSQDINYNFIPDACDLCALATDGCGPHASCMDGPNPWEFTCTCNPGYVVNDTSAPYDPVAFAAAIVSGLNTLRTTTFSGATSSNLASITPAFITSGVTARELNFLFTLRLGADSQAFVNSFAAAFEATLAECASCQYATLSYSVRPVTVEGYPETQLTVHILPWINTVVYTNSTGANRGCVDFNECIYGCGNNATCFDSTSPTPPQGVAVPPGSRLCVCAAGFTGSGPVPGNAAFTGCVAPGTNWEYINQCATYGCHAPAGSGLMKGECSSAAEPNLRTCTCPEGHQISDGVTSVVLASNGTFAGCEQIDFCADSPCGDNSNCVNTPEGAVCTCFPHFVDQSEEEDGTNCVDPCTIGKRCQDVCVPPSGGENFQCRCSNANAQLSRNGRNCECKSGFVGNGTTCAVQNACKGSTVWGSPFVATPQATEDPNTAVCGDYAERSCCNLNADVFNPETTFQFVTDGTCQDLLTQTFCSFCSPNQNFLSFQRSNFVVSICADTCQEIFNACNEGFVDEQENPIVLTDLYHSPRQWCEEFFASSLPYSSNSFTITVDARGSRGGRGGTGSSSCLSL